MFINRAQPVSLTEGNFDEIINNKDIPSLEVKTPLKKEQLLKMKDWSLSNKKLGYIKWHTYQEDNDTVKEIEAQLLKNLEQYRYYPSDYDLALLSKAATTHIKQNASVSDSLGDVRINKHWKVVEVINNTASGYYGVIYGNAEDYQLVLAHRAQFTGFKHKVATELKGTLRNQITDLQYWAKESVKKAVELAKEKEYGLTITGNLVGGWLAELSLYHCHFELNYKNAKAIVFDSPGSSRMMEENYKSNLISPETKRDISELNIVTYLLAPNPINCLNTHVGTKFQIFPNLTFNDWLPPVSKVIEKVSQSVTAGSVVPEYIGRTFLEHNLDLIIDSFDPLTGKPKEYLRVLDWPLLSDKSSKSTNDFISSYVELVVQAIVPMVSSFIGSHIGGFRGTIIGGVLGYATGKWLNNYYTDKILSSYPEASELAHVLADLFQEDISQTQYLSFFKHLNATNGYKPNDDINSKTEFLLKYESHYNTTRDINRYMLAPIDHPAANTDWYFKELAKKNSVDTSCLSPLTISHIKSLTDKYLIDQQGFIVGRNYSVDVLKQVATRIINVNPEMREKCVKNESYLPDDVEQVLFIGRKNELKSCINALDTTQRLATISGIAGIGKSTFAVKCSNTLAKESGYIVRWFDADKGSKLDAQFRIFAKTLMRYNGHENYNNNKPIERIINNIKPYLQKNYVFILDNVEKYEDIENYLKQLPENVKFIITTRDSGILANNIPEHLHVQIDRFNQTEIVEYISKELEGLILLDDVQKLATASNVNIPLTLNKVITYIQNHPSTNIDELIKIINNGEFSKFLFQKIKEESPEAWTLLQYLAFLESDFTPISIFNNLTWINENTLKPALNALVKQSLIKMVNSISGDKGVKFHSISQEEVLIYRQNESINELKDLELLYLNLGEYHQLVQLDYDISLKYFNKSLELIKEKKFGEFVESRLLNKIGLIYHRKGAYDKALEYYWDAFKKCKNLTEVKLEDLNFMTSVLNNIGSIQQSLGKYSEAEYMLKATLDMRQKYYDKKDNQYTAVSLSNLGSFYYDVGRYEEALERHQEAVNMLTRLYPDGDDDLAIALDNMGRDLFKLNQPYDALDKHHQAYKMIKVKHIDNHNPSIGMILSNIGGIYIELGKEKLAIEKYFEDALKICNKIFGNIHHGTAMVLHSIGHAYYHLGNYAKAAEYFEKTLNVLYDLYQSHPMIDIVLYNLDNSRRKIDNSEPSDNEKIVHEEEKTRTLQINKDISDKNIIVNDGKLDVEQIGSFVNKDNGQSFSGCKVIIFNFNPQEDDKIDLSQFNNIKSFKDIEIMDIMINNIDSKAVHLKDYEPEYMVCLHEFNQPLNDNSFIFYTNNEL